VMVSNMGDFRGEYFESVSATSTNSAVSFSFPARLLTITNAGPNRAYFSLVSTTGATSGPYLEPGEFQTFSVANPDNVCTGLGIICDTGETATVRVMAWR